MAFNFVRIIMKSKSILTYLFCVFFMGAHAQMNREPGVFQLGMRNTYSLFGDQGTTGMGVGGQFRLMLGKKINTEWFADYIQNDLYNLGKRIDGHIGWSVMFYLLDEPKKIDPYLIAGHCFDYTKVTVYNSLIQNNSGETSHRWSSAAQMGVGTHVPIGEKFDLSLSAQYMVHLGNDIHTHLHSENGVEYLEIEQQETNNKLTFEGHLLLTMSLNIKIADLW